MKKSTTPTYRLPKIHPSIQVFLAIGLFALAVFFTRGESITSWESTLFLWINGWPEFLFPIFFVLTQLGSIFALGWLLVYFLIQQKYHVVIRLLLVGSLAYLVSGVAKDIWGRDRPFELFAEVVNRDYIVRGPGFPSGHVALATALALTVGLYLPKKYRWIVPVWIIGVALSRIYLGLHAPLDIIGGFAIGWLAYSLFLHVRMYDINLGHKSAKKNTK